MSTKEDQHLQIRVLDDCSESGAYHEYCIVGTGDEFAKIFFQEGPIENGVNGVSAEDILEVCRHRLQSLQNNRALACREYALAITKIEEALHWLDHRTMKNQRHVEGIRE